MASSTTRPMASTIASSVSVLMVKPSRYMSAKAPISETGMVTIGMSVARNERRKKKITSTTSAIASTMVVNTAAIERSMNTELSLPISTDMPSGSDSLTRGSTSRTACETSSGLATACLMTPTVIDGCPL